MHAIQALNTLTPGHESVSCFMVQPVPLLVQLV